MKLFAVIVGVIILAAITIPFVFNMLPSLGDTSDQVRSQPASDNLACEVLLGGTSCTIELSNQHIHGSLYQATVYLTDSGQVDVTGNSTLSLSDRRTITVSSLTVGVHSFTVNYRDNAPGVSSITGSLLSFAVPITAIVVLGAMALGLLAVFGVKFWSWQ